MKTTCIMKLTHCIHKCLACVLMTMMGIAGFSCSEDSNQGEDSARGMLGQISVAVITNDLATRSLGTFEGEPSSNELINTCIVTFIKEDGEIALIEELPAASGVSYQKFKVFLQSGAYRVYAFANFTESPLSSLNLKKGDKIDLEDFDDILFDIDATSMTQESKVPMSGFLADVNVAENGNVTVGGVAKNEVTVTVVRMVGKLEFKFVNNSSADIKVKEISFKPAAEGDIKLLPTWDSYENKTLIDPDMTLEGVTVGTEIKKSLSDMIIGNSDDNSKSVSFYVREVVSDHPTGGFPISIKLEHGNREEEMSALLYDLEKINRNDWIRVPIILTDRKLKLDVEFYPPIGGYPPVALDEEEDEYYVTFGTGGWFSIEASVVDKGDGSIVARKYVDISIQDEGGISNTAFFRRQPTVESNGDITGEIAFGLDNGAKSVVTIEVKLMDTGADGKLITTETFKRKIHFIYQHV